MRDGSAVGPVLRGGDPDDTPFALGELVATLRRPADLGPAVAAAVMSAIRLAPAPLVVVAGDGRRTPPAPQRAEHQTPAPLPRAWRWFTHPRSVRVSPLGALAAAGIAVVAVFGLRRDSGRGAEELGRAGGDLPSATGEFAAVRPTAEPASTPALRARDTVYVTQFMLVAPGAKHVSLVGDFNQWDGGATPLVHAASTGVWTVELPLPPGRHTYSFVVDGQRWMADPRAPRAIGDDFGRPSSVVTVRPGEV